MTTESRHPRPGKRFTSPGSAQADAASTTYAERPTESASESAAEALRGAPDQQPGRPGCDREADRTEGRRDDADPQDRPRPQHVRGRPEQHQRGRAVYPRSRSPSPSGQAILTSPFYKRAYKLPKHFQASSEAQASTPLATPL